MQVSRLKVTFAISVAILVGFGVTAIYQTFAWGESAALVTQGWQAVSTLENLQARSSAIDDLAQRLSINFSSSAAVSLRNELESMRKLGLQTQTMLALPAAAPDSIRNADWQNLKDLVDWKVNQFSDVLAGASTQSAAAAWAAWESSDGPRRLSETLEGLRQDQTGLIDMQARRQAAMLSRTRQLFVGAVAVAIFLLVATGLRVIRDARRRSDAETALATQQEQYRQVVEQAGDIIYRTDAQGRFTFINQAALAMLHFTENEIISRSYLKVVRPDHRRQVERFYIRQNRRRKNSYLEFPVIDGHGRTRWIGQNVQILMEKGKVTGYQAIARDITERRKAEAELEKSKAFVERIALATPGLLYVFDLVEKRNVFSNREVAATLGYRMEEFQNRADVLDLVHPDDRPAVNCHYEALRTALDGEVRRLEYRMKHADGHWVWLLGRDTPFERDTNGTVRQIVGIAQDVTARRAAQEKLAWQANFDALTGLSNRHHFWTRLQSTLRRASLEQTTASLCLFDVDCFKEINDKYGHACGDEVLEAIGSIVRTDLRSNDIAGRVGGDEFCLVLPGTDRDEAARVAERIRERLITQAFGLNTGSPFTVTATFGVAEWQPHMETREVMEAADRALYRAKSAGRNRVCVDV